MRHINLNSPLAIIPTVVVTTGALLYFGYQYFFGSRTDSKLEAYLQNLTYSNSVDFSDIALVEDYIKSLPKSDDIGDLIFDYTFGSPKSIKTLNTIAQILKFHSSIKTDIEQEKSLADIEGFLSNLKGTASNIYDYYNEYPTEGTNRLKSLSNKAEALISQDNPLLNIKEYKGICNYSLSIDPKEITSYDTAMKLHKEDNKKHPTPPQKNKSIDTINGFNKLFLTERYIEWDKKIKNFSKVHKDLLSIYKNLLSLSKEEQKLELSSFNKEKEILENEGLKFQTKGEITVENLNKFNPETDFDIKSLYFSSNSEEKIAGKFIFTQVSAEASNFKEQITKLAPSLNELCTQSDGLEDIKKTKRKLSLKNKDWVKPANELSAKLTKELGTKFDFDGCIKTDRADVKDLKCLRKKAMQEFSNFKNNFGFQSDKEIYDAINSYCHNSNHIHEEFCSVNSFDFQNKIDSLQMIMQQYGEL